MKAVNISYVLYFNKRYNRVGHLFQDRFKSEAIEDDRYLLGALRYIHNNLMEEGIGLKQEEYKWSSYREYINEKDKWIIDLDVFLKIFSENRKDAIKVFVEFSNKCDENEYFDENIKEKRKYNCKKYINMYLKQHRLIIEDLKRKENILFRNELIVNIKEKQRLSMRKIAVVLSIDCNIIQRVK